MARLTRTTRSTRISRYGSAGAGFPPSTLNVIDRHGGFTAVTMPRSWAAHLRDARRQGVFLHKREGRHGGASINGQTVWRPGQLLKKTTTGRLVDYATNSFYQTNNDVTVAIYKVQGYPHPVAVWFDNKTRNRIA